MQEQPLLRIHTIGMFRVFDSRKTDLRPRGQKACALIAMLATAPDLVRPKAWLMDHLWSDRAPEQASGSLRQALREIRKSLGPLHQVLYSSHHTVGIDKSKIWVDINDSEYLDNIVKNGNEDPVFLFDISIKDREFENWIRDWRLQIDNIIDDIEKSNEVEERNIPKDLFIVDGGAYGTDKKKEIFSEILSGLVFKSISDAGTVEVVDALERDAFNSNSLKKKFVLVLESRAFEFGSQSGAKLVLTKKNFDFDGKVLLNVARILDNEERLSLEQQEILSLINEAVDLSIQEFSNATNSKDDPQNATSLCFHAVDKMFNMDAEQLSEADSLLEKAYEMDQRAVYLAWRAYLRTFVLGEKPEVCRDSTMDEMRHFMHHAMEAEPSNSLVLALSSFVTSMWLLNHEAAFELATKSVRINPANPLANAYLGIVNTHLGNFEEGYRLTQRANNICSTGPHRHVVTYAASASAAYAGHHDEAIRLGENLRRVAPSFGAQLRLLSVLYAKTGQTEKSEDTVRTLQLLEPEFSLELMKESFYRSAIIRESELMVGV